MKILNNHYFLRSIYLTYAIVLEAFKVSTLILFCLITLLFTYLKKVFYFGQPVLNIFEAQICI